MARFRVLKNTFSSGELSPKLHRLAGLNEYQRGLAEQLNQISISTGGSFSRPGTRFLNNVFSSNTSSVFTGLTKTDNVALIPYTIDSDTGYFIVLQFVSGGSISSNSAVLVDSNGATYGTVQTWTGYQALNYSGEEYPWDTTRSVKDIQYIQDGKYLIITHTSKKFQPIVIEATITGISYIRSWMHPNLTDGTFTSELSRALRMPTNGINIDTEHVLKNNQQAGGGSSVTTVTTVDSGGTNANLWTDDDVGKVFLVDNGTTSYTFLVDSLAAASPTHTANVTQLYAFGTTAVSSTIDNWWKSSWSGPSDLWPSCVGYYEGRLIFGSNEGYPIRTWCSLAGNTLFFREQRHISNVSKTLKVPEYDGSEIASDPFNFEPNSDGVRETQWISAGSNLNIGTDRSEFIGGGIQSQFSNANSFIKQQDSKGARSVQPFRTNDGVIFVGRNGRVLLQFKYSENNGSHITRNISLLADHIVYHNATTTTLTDITYTQLMWQNSNSILWAITSDNQLVGVTIDPDTDTLAWHKHTLGGNGKVLSMACLNAGTFDELVLLVKRTVGVTDYYSLEKIGGFSETTDTSVAVALDVFPDPPILSKEVTSHDLPWHLDNSVYMYSAVAKTSFDVERNQHDPSTYTAWVTATSYSVGDLVEESGNLYLCTIAHTSGVFATDLAANKWGAFVKWNPEMYQNQEVSVIADGVYVGEKTLSGYTLTLDTAANTVIVGSKFTKRIKTLPIAQGSQIGDSMEPLKRIDRLQISVYKSKGGSYGSDVNDLKPILYTGASNTLETTDFVVEFPSSNDRYAQVILEEQNPVPMNIIALSMRGVLHDG